MKKRYLLGIILVLVVFLTLSTLSVLSFLPVSSAYGEYICADYSITNISPTSVGINEEFTIGVQIEACGPNLPDFVSFELINPPTDITIKEPLLINITNFYSGNSERFIVYHMKTKDDAHPGTHLIKTKLIYYKNGISFIKDRNFSFDVYGEKAELNIGSIKTKPVLPKQGDVVELTLRIENVGEGTAKSIQVYADYPFQGVKQSFIGSLDADEDAPAIFTFITDKSGVFEFPITITYSDDFGEKTTETDVEININEKKSNLGIIIIIIAIIIIFGLIIFYLITKNKSKDKIIHQLLKGNDSKEKGKK